MQLRIDPFSEDMLRQRPNKWKCDVMYVDVFGQFAVNLYIMPGNSIEFHLHHSFVAASLNQNSMNFMGKEQG